MATQTTPETPVARRASTAGLERQGLNPRGEIHWNLIAPELIEQAVRRGEGTVADMGPFVAVTAPHTGRSPNDKFVVKEPASAGDVDWGKVNHPMTPAAFARLRTRVVDHLDGRQRFTQELAVRTGVGRLAPIHLTSESPAHVLFARHLFVRPDGQPAEDGVITILHAPSFLADPVRDDVSSQTVIAIDAEAREIVIVGTRYAGEIKKSVFTLLQYLLPAEGVATLHGSANIGPDGRSALFFGLSGTGKTTLSTDPTRGLIGDDEHGWGDDGIFNFEGGSYAKAIDLSPEKEPEIHAALHSFGTVLENVVLDPETRAPLLGDDSLTENTRAAFPIEAIPGAVLSGAGGHPSAVVMLTADAFGVLPPVARLSLEQAMETFLLGYTSKIPGTERGVTEPEATFSACFSAPFLPLPPRRYADLLAEKIQAHGPSLWLVNTGWTGGPYGVGSRMDIAATRAIIRAIVSGELDDIETEVEPHFGLALPVAVPGVPAKVLRPWESWADPAAYATEASKLASTFRKRAGAL